MPSPKVEMENAALQGLSARSRHVADEIGGLLAAMAKAPGVTSRAQAMAEIRKAQTFFQELATHWEEQIEDEEEADPAWDAYRAAAQAIDDRVEAAVKASGQRKCRVDYSAYETTDDDVPIDNLDEVAAKGKVRLVGFADDFFGGGKSRDYRSEVLDSPTWLQVAVEANRMIRTTRDTHHCFLEGLDKLPKDRQTEPGVTLYEFVMGS